MNEDAGTLKAVVCGVLAPATDAGKTISVTAEPGTVVPGVTSQSTPTVQPFVDVPTGSPMIANASLKRVVVPPAGVTWNMILFGETVLYDEML